MNKTTLTSIDEALGLLLDEVNPVTATELMTIDEALGRVLAVEVKSPVEVPPADNSAMDGYALKLADWQAQPDNYFAVSQRIAAGDVGVSLQPGTIARIFTGAEVPPDADAVVMQEKSKVDAKGLVHLEGPIELRQNVRPMGQDIEQGQIILSKGHRLRAQDLGLLASIGVKEVETFKPLKVALISTGDELLEPGEPLKPGHIYNSNRYTLLGLLQTYGYELLDYGVVADTAEATHRVLAEAAQQADCIISSGGVSVGEEDHVKEQVEALGELRLWKLAIKPGKPLAYGHVKGTPFLGLPGNPAAAYVTYRLVAQPLLAKMQNAQRVLPVRITAAARFQRPKKAVRQEYLRARLEYESGELVADIYPNQSSGVLRSVSWANALVIVPVGETIAVGDTVQLILLEEPFC